MSSPSSPSPHLLHADEEQLDRTAIVLRTGTAFVVAICPPSLRPAALGRFRGKLPALSLPDPVQIEDAEQMLDALVEQSKTSDRALSLMLGGDVPSTLDALNLHREKVLEGGPVILWLPDVDALVKLRERAPDAFSFRSTMAVVKGDGGGLSPTSRAESEEVKSALRRLKRARTPLERAQAGAELAENLRMLGQINRAEEMARTALLHMSHVATDDERMVRVRVCRSLAAVGVATGEVGKALHWVRRALAEVEFISFALGLHMRAMILATWPGPDNEHDRRALEEALQFVRTYGPAPESQSAALRSAANLAVSQGNVRLARRLLHEYPASKHLMLANVVLRLRLRGQIEEAAGGFLEAESHFREALTAGAEAVFATAIVLPLAGLLAARGELDSAERMVSGDWGQEDAKLSLVTLGIRANLKAARGDIAASLELLKEFTREAVKLSLDGRLLGAWTDIVSVTSEAWDAQRTSASEIAALVADLAVASDIILALVGPDGPPWYPSQLLSLRARLLSLTPETLSQALDLSREALALAHKDYPDLTPEIGRTLADHLLVAHQPDEALAAIADVEPYAAEHGYLKERARLLADRVLALILRGDAPETIAPHVAALREACAAMDAPRITAETLRDLAKRLPPACTTPDPYALAEEAHALFIAMPMPAEEARCLEIMGDVDLARGRPEEAKRRYLAARARLERYGLGLRLPLVTRKSKGELPD